MAAHDSTTSDALSSSDSRVLDSISDRSLLRRFRSGEDDAATALYLRYAKRLHALAQTKTAADLAARVDADGIVQSVFRTFFRRAAKGQYDVPDGEQLWKLFLVIALNKIRDTAAHHRAQKRDVGRTQPMSPGGHSMCREDGGNAEALAVLRMTIDDLLDAMPGTQRDIVALRIEGHEVTEIARRTKRSLRSVERLLQKFRSDLREVISD